MGTVEKAIFEAYRATGRSAFYYPRKGTVSLNGFRAIPLNEAVLKMKKTLAADGEKRE